MKNSTYYRGRLDEAEDNFNCRMSHVTVTDPRGRVSHLEHVYIRGSHMRFVILPDILKHAPMFKRVLATKKGRVGASGLGRIRAQAIQRAGGSARARLRGGRCRGRPRAVSRRCADGAARARSGTKGYYSARGAARRHAWSAVVTRVLNQEVLACQRARPLVLG